MAIYSGRYAKELIADSMRLDPNFTSPTGVRILAVLKGDRKERAFYVTDLLADNGRQEIQDAIAALRSKSEESRTTTVSRTVAEPSNVTSPRDTTSQLLPR